MSKKIVHTCYGCPYYYRYNHNGEKEYLEPYSGRYCEIENTWDCEYFVNNGEPQKRISKGE